MPPRTRTPAAADADDDLSDLDVADYTFPAALPRTADPRAEPEDVVLPLRVPHTFLEAPRTAPLPPRSAPPRHTKRASTAQEDAPLRRQRTRTRPRPRAQARSGFPCAASSTCTPNPL